MGIDYSCLAHGPDRFKDGLEFFEDIKKWSEEYEESCMVPNSYNHQLAEETTRILLASVPSPMRGVGKKLVTALMTDRLRRAMLYDPISPNWLRFIKFAFGVRSTLLTWLIPPRPYSMRYRSLTDQPDPKTGRYYTLEYDGEPWYVTPQVWISMCQ